MFYIQLMQIWLNLLFCVSIHGLSPMKITSTLLVNHNFIWVTEIVHNAQNISIGLNIICHETFEVWMRNTIFHHHLI
jgi:hypothetical protein